MFFAGPGKNEDFFWHSLIFFPVMIYLLRKGKDMIALFIVLACIACILYLQGTRIKELEHQRELDKELEECKDEELDEFLADITNTLQQILDSRPAIEDEEK